MLELEERTMDLVQVRPANLLSQAIRSYDTILPGRQTFLGRKSIERATSWSFWREWYQGFLDGKPMDWELQLRVAMIADADWEQGPEHIARVIEAIRARFELEKRLEALEAERLLWEAQGRHGLGGNNPPEQIEEAVVQEFILEPIESLKAETQEATPDRSRVQTAVAKLTAILVACGKWTGGKLDMAVDECVKSIGKFAGPALLGWISLNSDRLI